MKIEIKNATKIIAGNKVLDDISMTLEGGNIYGFVGHNGSGKTMLLRAISQLIRLSSGEILFSKKCEIGLLIENIGLYSDLNIYENLKLLAKIKNKISKEEIHQAITLVGLNPDDKRPLKKYSLGMHQRAALCQAIMETPEILLLDEPTNSLDSEGMEIVRQQVKVFKERGAIVILTSHNREDIKALCDVIFKFENGRVAVADKEEF
ncbi:MAG: ABC transporter ATP-binding protein [Oscillospiraceae bacterium]|nr:ABC transporter ATP-binding protein [Oscillospiraceae bacterium]